MSLTVAQIDAITQRVSKRVAKLAMYGEDTSVTLDSDEILTLLRMARAMALLHGNAGAVDVAYGGGWIAIFHDSPHCNNRGFTPWEAIEAAEKAMKEST